MMSAVAGKMSVTLSQDDAIARAQLSPGAQVELVWVPSQATQSMLDPVWAVSHGDRAVYVDQRGKRWEQLVPKGPGG
jgi:hypothetical protein